MSTTDIEWTKRPGTVGVTWNVTTGCNKVDRGCKNCYAQVMHGRLQAMGQRKYERAFLDGAHPWIQALVEPERWRKPRTVFVNSMSDIFHEAVPFNFLIQVFDVMRRTPKHTYLILTKRPERALQFYDWMQAASAGQWEFPTNVWGGTSVNDQDSANKRIPLLLQVPFQKVFVSYEPATGPVDFSAIEPDGATGINVLRGIAYEKETGYRKYDTRALDWVIMGGESGAYAEPMHPQWARAVRDACKEAAVPFFFKQFGTWVPADDFATLEVGRTRQCKYLYDEAGHPTKMARAKQKSYNLLDGQLHQNFPA